MEFEHSSKQIWSMKPSRGLLFMIAWCSLGCAAQPPLKRISWEELHQSPQKFSEKRIKICGWFEAKRELCSLSSSSTNLGTNGAIWVFPEGDWCNLDQAVARPFEGWATLVGYVHWGDAYGHFGAWEIAMDRVAVSPAGKSCPAD